MNTNEHDDATPRAGGDIITKSASQKPEDSEDMANSDATQSQSGTRAGGDIITKGASQKNEE